MCGRYSLSAPLEELVETFDVGDVVLAGYRPRYNVAPTQDAPVLVRGASGLRLGELRWGLIPWWAEDERIGARMINARSETARTLPAFRDAFRTRRCLVPADGFYEWKPDASPSAKGRPPRTPWWIHRPDRSPFAFAGLWERWRPEDGRSPIHSFTILTTSANARLAPLHDRMPVVLGEEALEPWLDPASDPATLERLLAPAPDGLLDAWPVSTLVNAPANDEPGCLVPVEGEGR